MLQQERFVNAIQINAPIGVSQLQIYDASFVNRQSETAHSVQEAVTALAEAWRKVMIPDETDMAMSVFEQMAYG